MGVPSRRLAGPARSRRLGDRLVGLHRPPHRRAGPGRAGEAAANHGLSLSLIKGLANGLRKLDAETLAKLPQTFAELQPLLAAKGVALATDTKDYMIPVAVEANKLQDRLGLIGGVVALLLALAGGASASARSRRGRGPATASRR